MPQHGDFWNKQKINKQHCAENRASSIIIETIGVITQTQVDVHIL